MGCIILKIEVLFVSCEVIDEFCDSLWLEDGLFKNMLDVYWCDMILYVYWLY